MPQMPVLIVSGFAEMTPGEDRGDPVLAKPFTRTQLARALTGLQSSAKVVPLRKNQA